MSYIHWYCWFKRELYIQVLDGNALVLDRNALALDRNTLVLNGNVLALDRYLIVLKSEIGLWRKTFLLLLVQCMSVLSHIPRQGLQDVTVALQSLSGRRLRWTVGAQKG